MKFKTTRKEIHQNFKTVICIPYCGAQDLLQEKNPIAYNYGVYGWNYDLYDVGGGVAIVTGYRPFGNIRPDGETLQKYEYYAHKICYDCNIEYKSRVEQLDKLIDLFIEEVTR